MASVGNAGGIEFSANVLPFLLRGINVCGIDSNTCSKERRLKAWTRLARELPLEKLDEMTNEISLTQLPEMASNILRGEVRGRILIDVNA